MKRADIQDIKVTELFEKDRYEIPIYQRNYSWEDTQIRALIEDVCDVENNTYYLGTLIVDKKEDSYEVIDGQQRLTTLFLLLSYLNNNYETKYNLTQIISFETREHSNKILSSYVNGNKQDDNDNTLIKGYKKIETILKENEKDVKRLINNLEKVVIIRVPVPEKVDLNHYFEVMNTRGEQLQLHEISKNKFLSVLNDENDNFDSEVANVIWEACSDMDKYVQMNFKSDVRGIIFGSKWNSFDYKNFDEIADALKGKLGQKSISERIKITDILSNNYTLDDNKEPNKNDEEFDKKGYESIISFPQFLLHVNLLMISDTSEDEKLLDDKELLSHMKKYYTDKQSAKDFIFNLLRYRYYFDKYILKRDYTQKDRPEGVWRIQKLNQYETKNGNKRSLTANPVKYDNSDLLVTLQASLRITYISPKNMYWIREVLSYITYERDKDEVRLILDLRTILEKYCCDKLMDTYNSNEEKNPFGEGFAIPRIVFTYLDYILYRDRQNEFKDYEVKYRTSIEHFYPQHPENAEYLDEKYLNNFGNLALITVSGNSKVSNFIPQAKYKQWENDVIKQSPKLMLMGNLIKDKDISLNDYKEIVKEHNSEMIELLRKELKLSL